MPASNKGCRGSAVCQLRPPEQVKLLGRDGEGVHTALGAGIELECGQAGNAQMAPQRLQQGVAQSRTRYQTKMSNVLHDAAPCCTMHQCAASVMARLVVIKVDEQEAHAGMGSRQLEHVGEGGFAARAPGGIKLRQMAEAAH